MQRKVCFLQYREPLILAWCRHVCLLLVSSRSSRQSRESLTVTLFQKPLGLMAAASNVTFGLLHMRPLQWWLRITGCSPRGNPFCTIKVTRRRLRALNMWKKPCFLSQGPVLAAPCHRLTLTMDSSRPRSVGRSHLMWHINCLEVLAVFKALKHFLLYLRGHHVLVCTDNTSVVSYILRSRYPVETGAEARGNGCLTPRWWSRFGRSLAKSRWTCLRLKRPHNVPSGSLELIQLHWVCMPPHPLNALLSGVLE